MKTNQISHLVIMGDSLSDRGMMYHRFLLGFIPMRLLLTELRTQSPLGRFTNGFVWSDHISATLANEFIIKKIKKKYDIDSTDIADAIINGDERIKKQTFNSYHLHDEQFVTYDDQDFVRSYDEAGLTAHNYKWVPSKSPSRFFKRLIVSNLANMRKNLLSHDVKRKISKKHKEQTLIVEWSGANDLISANEKPSKIEVDKAIIDRIYNAEQLIKNGYRHFILFNLPDLSITPYYQSKNKSEQQNAFDCSDYFNKKLRMGCKELRALYPECSIEIFDVNAILSRVYKNPEKYGFDSAKIHETFTGSHEFNIKENGTSPAKGFMFWDSIHPSASMHAKLAQFFYEKYRKNYDFSAPQNKNKTHPERSSSLGEYESSSIKDYQEHVNLSKHGLFKQPSNKGPLPFKSNFRSLKIKEASTASSMITTSVLQSTPIKTELLEEKKRPEEKDLENPLFRQFF